MLRSPRLNPVAHNPSSMPSRPPWVVLAELQGTGKRSVYELALTTDMELKPSMLLALDLPPSSPTETKTVQYWAVAQEGGDYRSATRGKKSWEGFAWPLPRTPGPLSVWWGYSTGPGMDDQYEMGRVNVMVTADQLAAVRR